jgi:iron complex outermembrane recepter protein
MSDCMKTGFLALLSATTCVAALNAGACAFAADANPASPSARAVAEVGEVIVTAQRREERLNKVPISIAAYSGKQLQQIGAADMSDISRATPGFNVVPGATIGGGANLSIRGVSTVQGAATIGVYLDDTPVQDRANNWTQPINPGLFDLQRVEVLRGPQGTLYGASSEGGTVRFISTPPSLTTWSGQALGEISGNARGGLGYETALAAGGPIVQDKLGFRASIDDRRDGGFIDQMSRTTTGRAIDKNINDTDSLTAKVALTWAPTSALSITPSFYYQRLHGADDGLMWSGLWPTSGRYQSFEATLTPYTDKIEIGSLKASYDFGWATLTSISSWEKRDLSRTDDYSAVAIYNIFKSGSAAFLAANPGYQSPQSTLTSQRNFSEEVRLSTNDQSAPIYGVAGLFYSYAKQSLTQIEWADANAAYPSAVYFLGGGPLIPGQSFNTNVPAGPFPNGGVIADKYQTEIDQQTAAFIDLTWNVTHRLKASAGVRVGREAYSFQYIGNGYFQGGPQILPKTSTNATIVNPKFNISYQVTDADMVYATVAKGERPGGVNRPIPAARCALDISLSGNIPQTYTDDTVWSYEGGVKARLLGDKVSLNGSVFYLNWHNVQQNLILSNCAFSYVGNFGDATSKGFDLNVQASPLRGVSIGANVGYTDSRLSQNVLGTVSQVTHVAPVLAVSGSQLALVPNWTADVDVEWTHDLPWMGLNGSVRADYQYEGPFKRTPGPGSTLYNPVTYKGAGYDVINLRASVGKDAWRATLFVKNLTNSYPILYLGAESGTTGYFNNTSTLSPRTVGANVTYHW